MTEIVHSFGSVPDQTDSQLSLHGSFIEVCIVDVDRFYPTGFVKIDGQQLPATQMIERSDTDRMVGIEPGLVVMFMLEGKQSDYRIELFADKIVVEVFGRYRWDDLRIHQFEGYEGFVEAFQKYCRESIIPDCLAAMEDGSRAIES